MCDMGYAEEGMRRIKANIDKAKKLDPTMKLYDLSGKSFKGAEPIPAVILERYIGGKLSGYSRNFVKRIRIF